MNFATVVLFDSTLNNVLLIKNNAGPFKGLWNVVGGKVEENDYTCHTTAVRELKEESGYDVECDLSAFEPLVSMTFPSGSTVHFFYGVLKLEHDPRIGDMDYQSDEGVLRWFHVDDVGRNHRVFGGEGNLPYLLYYARLNLK